MSKVKFIQKLDDPKDEKGYNTGMNNLPENVLKFFWGDRLEELDWEKHKKYITRTILEKGDKNAVGWLLKRVNKDYIKSIISEKKMDPKSENFWNIYLS